MRSQNHDPPDQDRENWQKYHAEEVHRKACIDSFDADFRRQGFSAG